MKHIFFFILIYISISFQSCTKKLDCINCKDNNVFSVLVITETDDFIHKSIDSGVLMVKNIGDKNNFNVYHSSNSKVLSSKNLKNISTIIFLNTSENILNIFEQKIMEKFIRSGRGFVGIHAAADTEYDWPWYGRLVGAFFRSHPDGTTLAKIKKVNTDNKITKHIDSIWEIEDEWYNFDFTDSDITVLLNLDEESYEGGENGDYHPITWFHDFDGGRSFYTGLGHLEETFKDEKFIELVKNGILYTSFRD